MIKKALLLGFVLLLLCITMEVEAATQYRELPPRTYGKSKWIAGLLALFFGTFGLHRLYLGHYKAVLFYPITYGLMFAAIFTLFGGFPIFLILGALLLLGYGLLSVIGKQQHTAMYLQPIKSMLLAWIVIPIVLALLFLVIGWFVFALPTLFAWFWAIRYFTTSRTHFIEQFVKNRSIWH